jgi:integrase
MTRKEENLKSGWTELPPWLFVTKEGMSVDSANVRRAMLRVLKAAKLPLHFMPHCLRHTYASILLAEVPPLLSCRSSWATQPLN